MQTSKQSYVDLTRDAGFKTVLGSKTNKGLLIGLLNYILPPENKVEDIIEYMDREQTPQVVLSKISYFDLTCRGKDGSIFIIEMQNHRERDFFQRCMYYGAETYGRELSPSMDYGDLRPVYVVAFLNFNFPHADEKSWNSDNFIASYIFKEKRTNEVAASTISVIFVELRRFTKAKEECKTEKDWLFYLFRSINLFDDLRKELNVAHFPLIEKMEQACKFAAMDPDQHSNYANIMRCERDFISGIANARAEAREEARKEALAEGITEGIAEGKKRLTEKLARKMLQSGMPTDQISMLLELSKEELQALS